MKPILIFKKIFSRLKNRVIIRLLGLKCYGMNMDISSPFVITGAENITIGDNFSSMGNLYLYGNDGYISIGNHVSVNTNVQIGSSDSKIEIGNNVLIGPNVVIRAADHRIAKAPDLIRTQGHSGSPITIEDDVWIGANCVVLKGVRIKKGAVICAGSVVLRNVEAYTVVAGVPAKKISSRMFD